MKLPMQIGPIVTRTRDEGRRARGVRPQELVVPDHPDVDIPPGYFRCGDPFPFPPLWMGDDPEWPLLQRWCDPDTESCSADGTRCERVPTLTRLAELAVEGLMGP
jgi:hypothetical protein